MKGLLSRHDVSHQESDVFMRVRIHRTLFQALPSYEMSLNVIRIFKRIPVVMLACEPVADSIVFSVGLDGHLDRMFLKDLPLEWRPLLDRVLVIGGEHDTAPVRYAEETLQQHQSISSSCTIECGGAMSDLQCQCVQELVLHSFALGAHKRVGIWDYVLLYCGRDGSISVVRLRHPQQLGVRQGNADDVLHQLQIFLGLRDQQSRSTRVTLADRSEFCAILPRRNGMLVSVSNRDRSVACALQVSFFVYRVITVGQVVGGDDNRVSAAVCSPVFMTEGLALCLEQLAVLHDPDFLQYMFGKSKKARAAIVAKAQTERGRKALSAYLAKSPTLLLPTHGQYFAVVLALSHLENVKVLVHLNEAKSSVPVVVDLQHADDILQDGSQSFVRVRNDAGNIDFDDPSIKAENIARLSCAQVAEFAWNDPYSSITQPYVRLPPAQLPETAGTNVLVQMNVDAFQVVIPVSAVYVEGSLPRALAWPIDFRGSGVMGGPPFSMVPRVCHNGISDQMFDAFWQSAKMEIEPVQRSCRPDYVEQLFDNRRYGTSNANREWFVSSYKCLWVCMSSSHDLSVCKVRACVRVCVS